MTFPSSFHLSVFIPNQKITMKPTPFYYRVFVFLLFHLGPLSEERLHDTRGGTYVCAQV